MKTKSAKYAKMSRGEYQSVICPYGYRKSADRSPGEFYQLDFEMAFATQEDVFAVAEEVQIGRASCRERV